MLLNCCSQPGCQYMTEEVAVNLADMLELLTLPYLTLQPATPATPTRVPQHARDKPRGWKGQCSPSQGRHWRKKSSNPYYTCSTNSKVSKVGWRMIKMEQHSCVSVWDQTYQGSCTQTLDQLSAPSQRRTSRLTSPSTASLSRPRRLGLPSCTSWSRSLVKMSPHF